MNEGQAETSEQKESLHNSLSISGLTCLVSCRVATPGSPGPRALPRGSPWPVGVHSCPCLSDGPVFHAERCWVLLCWSLASISVPGQTATWRG